MPNTAHRWTPAEERDAAVLDWDTFGVKYPEITHEAYRQRRGQMKRTSSPESVEGQALLGESILERAIKNNVKMARSVIRLRHSIEADDELAGAIPRIKLALQTQAQSGVVPGLSYEELRELVYGE